METKFETQIVERRLSYRGINLGLTKKDQNSLKAKSKQSFFACIKIPRHRSSFKLSIRTSCKIFQITKRNKKSTNIETANIKISIKGILKDFYSYHHTCKS